MKGLCATDSGAISSYKSKEGIRPVMSPWSSSPQEPALKNSNNRNTVGLPIIKKEAVIVEK